MLDYASASAAAAHLFPPLPDEPLVWLCEAPYTLAMDPLEALASRSFCRIADASQSGGNEARLLIDGPETFAAWLDAIGWAERFVALENYILEEDEIGAQFAQALLAAASRGVHCRVLYDWLGCLTRTSGAFWQNLRAGGVEVRAYNPPQWSNPLRWISRDHRKVLLVDDVIAFTGGLCIGRDWMGDPAKSIPPWRDTAIALRGAAAAQVGAAFEDSWACAHTGWAKPPLSPTLAAGATDDTPVDVSVIAGRPGAMGLYRLEQLVAQIAQHSLWLTDGYFVATTAYVRALTQAAQAGVDVRLLVPGSSNWPIVGALSKSAYLPLLEAGVRVFEWNGPMLHAKTAVADGRWTRIGSSNSNLASWITNRELDVTIKDADLARQMEAMFEADMANSTEVVLEQRRSALGRSALGRSGPGRSRVRKPAVSQDGRNRSPGLRGRRLLSGALGLGSTFTASITYRRTLLPGEAIVVLVGGSSLVLLGLGAIAFPRLFAWLFAVAAIWSGLGLVFRALKLSRSGARQRGG